MQIGDFIWQFQEDVSGLSLPEQFTYPFNYEPHPLVISAAQQLQAHLRGRDFGHDFGFSANPSPDAIGKMFGVLVVQDPSGALGFLAAFSGKLADENHHSGFVPPVFDILEKDGYFRTGEEEIKAINIQVEELEKHPEFISCTEKLRSHEIEAEREIKALKTKMAQAKVFRDKQRKALDNLPEVQKSVALKALAEESAAMHYEIKDAKRKWKREIEALRLECINWQAKIDALKQERKNRSAALQSRMFSDYNFLNAEGEFRSLLSIFKERGQNSPPSGAGECAAPKLLHFAYLHQLKPLALGEFWWGASPPAEVRSHKNFYPSCRGKCEPILAHMLKGLDVEQNPMLKNPGLGKHFEIVFEDEHLLVINKPAGMLSVPGKNIYDSVLTRLEGLYPEATGPLLVHRLDMSTSGLLLAAKQKDVHKHLQEQFLQRKVIKRYEALLDGSLEKDRGEIKLPLRVDLDNRPRQLVCYEHGKKAHTHWEKIEERGAKTLVNLFPKTGRTHQLRVHCAHKKGLNTPILGDDLYGARKDRLYLHAAYLKFQHPVNKEQLEFYVASGF
ncbi:MAG: pseudouridine synthase [Luteibaculum sp.]